MTVLTIARLAQVLQNVLLEHATRLARLSGFVQREVKVTGTLFVQTLVFGFLAHPQATWDQLAASAATVGLCITGAQLLQRCTPPAATFLQQVLDQALSASLSVHAAPVAIPILQRFTDVRLQDSTQLPLPAALAELWEASGNQTPQATLKLQTCLSVTTGALHVALYSGRTSDHQLPAEQCEYRPGSLRLADLGYFDLAELARLAKAGVFWLTHVLHYTAVYTDTHTYTAVYTGTGTGTGTGRRWNLLDLLAQHRAPALRPEGLDLPIQLGAEAHLPCRLLAKRVPRRVAAERERRLWEQARDKGETVSAAQLAMTRWVVFVTNVPVAQLSVAEALVLARVRWQIELVFKLWKHYGALDKSHSHKPYCVLCEVYAKLLAMLIQHWTFVVGLWHHPERSLFKAAAVFQTRVMALAMALPDPRWLRRVLRSIIRSLEAGCRITKRKGVPATFQLLLALAASS